MPTVRFFAADDDLVDVLTRMEQTVELQYVTRSDRAGYSVTRYQRASDIRNLTLATHESGGANTPYLVAARNTVLLPRRVTLANGTSFDAFDQFASDGTATLVAAGRWGSDVVLSGTFDTTHVTPEARRLMSVFSREMKKTFRRIRAFWVGPAALQAFDSGARLTGAVQSPAEYDLRHE